MADNKLSRTAVIITGIAVLVSIGLIIVTAVFFSKAGQVSIYDDKRYEKEQKYNIIGGVAISLFAVIVIIGVVVSLMQSK